MWFEVFSIYLASRKEAVILISISSERCQTRLQFTGEQFVFVSEQSFCGSEMGSIRLCVQNIKICKMR